MLMDELPIFLSYRQADGMELARWVHDALQGRTVMANERSLSIPKTISAYFDEAAPPVGNWREHLKNKLRSARALIVICSPGVATELPEDILYSEIRWWIKHRKNNPPILITPTGQQWIPNPIKKQWPYAQTINLFIRNPVTNKKLTNQGALEALVQRILQGIQMRLRGIDGENATIVLPDKSQTKAGIENLPGIYTWEKDRHGRYICCNENYARAAGFDSPHAMVGKTDDDMPWRTLANFFRQGDQKVMNAESPARELVQEKEIMVDRVADILVTENQLLTQDGACVGVVGFFVDITGKQVESIIGQKNSDDGFNLGPEFGNQVFSNREASVFKGLLRKFPSEYIAKLLNIKKTEVEAHTASIMKKLQCQTHGDIIITSIRSGLPVFLFGLE